MTNTFSAIPTRYNGVQYRSRLEAKWAAFFDALRWEHVYEPLDCFGYIPDFVVHFAWPMTVECKPAVTSEDMFEACRKIDRSGWRGDALVVGAQLWPETTPFEQLSLEPIVRQICVQDGVFLPAPPAPERKAGAIRIGRMRGADDFGACHAPWIDAYLDCTKLGGIVIGEPVEYVWSITSAPHTLTATEFMLARIAWAEASNATQWMPGASTQAGAGSVARDIIKSIGSRKRYNNAPPTYDAPTYDASAYDRGFTPSEDNGDDDRGGF